MVKKSGSSRRWLAEHAGDEFVKAALVDGYRSRSSYKLRQINDKFSLLRPAQTVVDLGAAPGGWSQVAADVVGEKGRVIALDLLEIQPITNVECIQGDFTEDETLRILLEILKGGPVDLVISDMAPNLSGMKAIDQPRANYLVELALDFALQVLRPGGVLLTKCFEGAGIEGLRRSFRQCFQSVNNVKPEASRSRSREIYLLGRGLKREGTADDDFG